VFADCILMDLSNISRTTIAAHVIVALAEAQEMGRAVRLDELAADLDVRKADVRQVVTSLHSEGHVDALRLRLTMTGLALAASLTECKLRELRSEETAPISRVA
jgi:DNA-binding IscR family transcriptional regulator